MTRRELITLLGGGLLGGGALLATATFAEGTGRWTVGTPMPSARTEVAVAEVGGKIYVVGGFRGERELEVYDPAADRWSRDAAIPRALHHAGAVGLNGKLYVFALIMAIRRSVTGSRLAGDSSVMGSRLGVDPSASSDTHS